MSVDYLSSLKMIQGSFAGQTRALVLAIALATASVLLELFPIWSVFVLINALMNGEATQAQFFGYAALMAVAILAGFLCFGAATRLSHQVAFNLIYDLRLRLSRHMARLPLGYFARMRSGQAKQTIVTEPEKLELLIAHAIPEGSSALMSWFLVTGWLFYVDWRMALATMLFTPVSFFCMGLALKQSFSHTAALQDSDQKMNGAIVEYLASLPAIKIFSSQNGHAAEAASTFKRHGELSAAMGRAFVPMGGTFYALILSNISMIVVTGGWLLYLGQITPETFLFFVVLGANYSTPLMRLFDLFHHFAHISLAANNAQNVLSAEAQPDDGTQVALPHYNIAVKDVSFAYEGKALALKTVNFEAKAGQVTALVGPSGAGKSTMAQLLVRHHDITEGSITIGGVDIRDMALSQLMSNVAFVFQKPFLFTASVADNIRYGNPNASADEIRLAARAACAEGFVDALPQGFETVIGQGQQLLSGGEAQRIALARAILKDAPIVVLDEATAFTDPDSEYEIQQAIGALTADKTVIVIAHRLHTVAGADQILVFENGQIAERGTHATLLEQGGLYGQLWQDYMAARTTDLRSQEVSNVH